VDPARRTLTVRPWGIRGPLTWNDFDRSAGVMPAGATPDRAVEWVVQYASPHVEFSVEPETLKWGDCDISPA